MLEGWLCDWSFFHIEGMESWSYRKRDDEVRGL